MKILSTEQIRLLDQYTIEHENISSHALMERAAAACCEWIENHSSKAREIFIFCGPGNNGGDGLAIARMLFKSGYAVKAFILGNLKKKPDDFSKNLLLLAECAPELIVEIATESNFPFISTKTLVIDALFGTGLSKPLQGLPQRLIDYINQTGADVLAIDLPSGLYADRLPDLKDAIIRANHTLSFELPKFSFMFPSVGKFVGSWHLLKIGLSQTCIDSLPCEQIYITKNEMNSLLKPREKFSHKGNLGHALLVSGSKGKMGAAVIAASACLRSGPGLLTVHVPNCGVGIIQTAAPEAMVIADELEERISEVKNNNSYNAIGLGPGVGTGIEFKLALEKLLKKANCPMVLDADALNVISKHPELLDLLPENSILTPHVKEFERLTGKDSNEAERHELQKEFSRKYKVILVLKGAHTCITSIDGMVYFNSTGNPGMAKGGSGDALTGIILGLLAQAYSPLDAAQLGVFIHGLAGDKAKAKFTEYSMTAMDLVHCLPDAFTEIILERDN